MNRLENIAIRQRNTLFRDVVFAAFLALGTLLTCSAMSTVAHAASSHVISR
jgi:hypothetical protein